MKFLCGNCKAKYQIADEKVSGRTLRMTCRRCGEEILIRGRAMTASTEASASARAPARPPSGAAETQGSALGADFQRRVARHTTPPSPEANEHWHVAINDIPVGPMRREELARKIAAGAVNGESLAWCEGMDDWVAIAQLPELAALLAPPPPAAGSVRPAAPARARERKVISLEDRLAAQARATPPTPAVAATPPAAEAPVPIPSAPDNDSALLPAAPTPTPTPAPALSPATAAASAPAAEPLRPSAELPAAREDAGSVRGPFLGPMFVALCSGALLLMLGVVLGVWLFKPESRAAQPQAAAPAEVARAAVAPAQPPAASIELEPHEIEGAAPDQVIKARARPSSRSGRGSKPRPKRQGAESPALSQADVDMLRRMTGEGVSEPPSTLGSKPDKNPVRRRSKGLKRAQLTAVVIKQRPRLQRCYQSALRASGYEEPVKLTVGVTVGRAGSVKRVSVKGAVAGLPGLAACVKKSVKLWRFPAATDDTQTEFPLLFQPGA